MIKSQKMELLNELRTLNEKCLELYPRGKYIPAVSKEELEKDRKNLMKSGQLIVDFYNKTFIPKYSKYRNDFFSETKKVLEKNIRIIYGFIESKNDFEMTCLLLPKGIIKERSNFLEDLVEKLSKEI